MTDDESQAPHRQQELIAFQAGGQAFGFDAMAVREIRGWTAVTPLPNTPPHVCGVINLRGQVLPVVDFALRLGRPPTDPTPRHVIIVAAIGDQLTGLLVDSVSDIVSIASDAIQPLPEIASEPVRALVSGLVELNGQLMSLIRLDQVIAERTAQAA